MLRWRANIGAFVAAAFIPTEPNASLASVTNVTSFRTRRRQRRRISRYIADSAGRRTWRDSNHSKRCYAASRGIACSKSQDSTSGFLTALRKVEPRTVPPCRADFTGSFIVVLVRYVHLDTGGNRNLRP